MLTLLNSVPNNVRSTRPSANFASPPKQNAVWCGPLRGMPSLGHVPIVVMTTCLPDASLPPHRRFDSPVSIISPHQQDTAAYTSNSSPHDTLQNLRHFPPPPPPTPPTRSLHAPATFTSGFELKDDIPGSILWVHWFVEPGMEIGGGTTLNSRGSHSYTCMRLPLLPASMICVRSSIL